MPFSQKAELIRIRENRLLESAAGAVAMTARACQEKCVDTWNAQWSFPPTGTSRYSITMKRFILLVSGLGSNDEV
jgi:hypothetical protein